MGHWNWAFFLDEDLTVVSGGIGSVEETLDAKENILFKTGKTLSLASRFPKRAKPYTNRDLLDL